MKEIKNNICPEQEVLLAFSEGLLEKEEISSVNEHLMECDICLREIFIIKRISKLAEGSEVILPSELKEKALKIATGEPKLRKSLRHISEFIISLTDKGLSYISSVLPEGAQLSISGVSVPVTAFRGIEAEQKESLIIEENLKGITMKVVLTHTKGPLVTIKVFLIKDGMSLKNQRITLYQNETLLSSKITLKDGAVELPDLGYGYYSIRVPREDIELRFKISPQDIKE